MWSIEKSSTMDETGASFDLLIFNTYAMLVDLFYGDGDLATAEPPPRDEDINTVPVTIADQIEKMKGGREMTRKCHAGDMPAASPEEVHRCVEDIVSLRYEYEYRLRNPDKQDIRNDVKEEVKKES